MTGYSQTSSGQVSSSAQRGATLRSWRSSRAWFILIVSILLSLAVDLVSKDLAFRYVGPQPVVISREKVLEIHRTGDPRNIQSLVPRHNERVIIPYLLHFTLVLNPGAVFGMGPGQRAFFIAFTVGALAFSIYAFGSWTRPKDIGAHVAIGILIGGGLGNLFDRLVYACVRDFIHPLPGWTWPGGLKPFGETAVWPYVSNVADLFLLVGIAMLLMYLWRRDRGDQKASRAG